MIYKNIDYLTQKFFKNNKLIFGIDSLIEFINKKSGIVGYINLYSISILNLSKLNGLSYFNFVFESISSTLIFSKLFKTRIQSMNFDFSGIADPIFKNLVANNQNVVFVGGTKQDAEKFNLKIKKLYPQLNIKNHFHGHALDNPKINRCAEADKIVFIIGLGTPLQEEFAVKLYNKANIKPVILLCGGFISQTANADNINYYTGVFKLPIMRAIYRWFKDPRVALRFFRYYPSTTFSIIKYFILLKLGKLFK